MFLQKVNTGQAKPKLLDEVRITLRTNHYSPKTEESYIRAVPKIKNIKNLCH